MASQRVSGKDEDKFLKELRNLIFNEAAIWSDFGSKIQVILAFQRSLPEAELMEQRYREWGSAFLRKLGGGAHAETFNALYKMHAKGVNIAYVVYHVFNFVYGDLDKSVTLATMSEFHQCRTLSLDSLNRIVDHGKTLGQSLVQETLIEGDDPLAQSSRLKQDKIDLLHLINDATRAMEEIYAFELAASEHKDADLVRSRFLEIRLGRILPRNAERPWLPQLATLMNTAAEIILEQKWLVPATEKFYNAASLRTRMRNAKPEVEIEERIRARHPEFETKVLEGLPKEAMDDLRRNREFKPSDKSAAILIAAKNWRRPK